LFPIFGLFSAAFLLAPFASLWLILNIDPNKRLLRRVAYVWIGLVFVASTLEFTGSPYAVFEVSPQALSSPAGSTFLDRFKTLCTSNFVYKDNYDGNAASFQSELAAARANGRSYSAYVYFLAIPAQAGSLLVLLCAFGLIAYFKKGYITTVLAREQLNWEKNNIFVLFGLALTVSAVWCLYRLSYRIDNAQLFGTQNNPLFADYVVLFLFLVMLAVYISFIGFDLEKLAKTMTQLAAGATVIGLSLTAQTGLADHFFGLRASFQNIAAALFVLLILVGMGLLFNNEPPTPPPLEEDG
jgi:hypothetical protein